MIELSKWSKKGFDLVETANDRFSIIFSEKCGLQIHKGDGALYLSLANGETCYDLVFVNLKKRPDYDCLPPTPDSYCRRLLKIGGLK